MNLAKMFGGRKNKGAAPTTQEAIQKLRETEEMLTKKTDFLEKKIETEKRTAKQNASKNKRAAISALKRKKRLEKQLNQVDNTLSTIEFQREAIENANTNIEVMKALKYGGKALEEVHKELGVEDIDELVEKISEEMETGNDIQEALAGISGAFGDEMDEDELNAELEDLEQEDFDEKIININTNVTDDLPSVPTTDLPYIPSRTKESRGAEMDNDMAALEAWIS